MTDEPTSGETQLSFEPLVYGELRALAAALMSGERSDHTLSPTSLVHETWLRLMNSKNASSLDRTQFLGLASQSMRRILTEHARSRHSQKRGGGWHRTTLSGRAFAPQTEKFIIDLDRLLAELETVDAELVAIVELKFFGGSSAEEIASTLSLSTRTVKRRWRFARAWLQSKITEDEQ